MMAKEPLDGEISLETFFREPGLVDKALSRLGPAVKAGGPLVLAVSGLVKGAPLSASNRTPNKKHDDCPNGRANQTGPLACAIPAESLS
jgi:hypothetical protein